MNPPSFYRSKDPDDAFKHFFVVCCMGPIEDHTCAGCAKELGTWPGIKAVGDWWIAYVVCRTCDASMKAMPTEKSDHPFTTCIEDSDITRAIDARIVANNVWQMPHPDFDEDEPS